MKLNVATKLEFIDKAVSFSKDTTNDSSDDELKRTLNKIHDGLVTPLGQKDDTHNSLNAIALTDFNRELFGERNKLNSDIEV